MKQYEIWWAELPPPSGPRPVLLLTRDAAYRYLANVTVVEITSQPYAIPQEVALRRREGLEHTSVVRFDNIQTIPKTWLARKLGRLPASREIEAKHALGYALGWPELVRL